MTFCNKESLWHNIVLNYFNHLSIIIHLWLQVQIWLHLHIVAAIFYTVLYTSSLTQITAWLIFSISPPNNLTIDMFWIQLLYSKHRLNPITYTFLYTIIEKIIEEHYPKLQLLFNIETEPYSTVNVSPRMLRHALKHTIKGFKASRLAT